MTPNGTTRRLLLLTFAAAVVFLGPDSARGDLRLQQKAVVGFPIDSVLEVAQIEPGSAGAHRLAVLNGAYLLGLQWSPERSVYDQTFFVQLNFLSGGGGGNMTFADMNGDGRNDIVVFARYPSTDVAAYDSSTGALLETFRFQDSVELAVNPLIAEDLDGVPGNEMIVQDVHGGITAYKGDVQLWRYTLKATLVPETRAAIARGELFMTTGTELIVLDARTGQERRRVPTACYQAIAGQSDFDANAEIACPTSTGVQLIDATTGAIQWTRSYPEYYGRRVSMFDVNGDGIDDVFVRSDLGLYKESVTVLNGMTGALMGETRTFDSGGVVAGITNGCESPAVVVTEGGGTTVADKLSLLDGTTLKDISTYSFDSYASTGFAVADVDGDGGSELVVAHNGKLSTLRLEPRSTADIVNVGSACCSFRGMAAVQLDGDAASEYLVASVCGGYLGCVTAWDPPKSTPLWSGTMDDGEIPFSVLTADVDGDHAPDVLSASGAVHSGAKGQFVYAFRGRDGKQLWRSINIPGSRARVRVADVEGKGTPQVLALSSTVGIVRLNLSNGSVSGFYEFKDGNAFATYQGSGDPRAKVVVAASDRLFLLDDGQVKAEVRGPEVAGISEIEIADVDGDGAPEILLAQNRSPDVYTYTVRLQVRSIETLAPLWTSEEFRKLINFQQAEQIAVADVDYDGIAEVLFLSSLTVRVFKPELAATGTNPPRFASSAALNANVRVRSCCAAVYLHWDHAQPGTAPPLEYRVYRAGTAGEPEVLLATTSRNEFVDFHPGVATGYRYSVAVVDAAGHAAPERLTTEVKATLCHRPAGKR